MKPFVEQQIGAGRNIFPGREFTGFLVATQAGIVFLGLFLAVQIVTLLTAAGFTVDAEQFLDLVETVGFRTEMTHALGHLVAHFGTVITVKAVAFDDGGLNALAGKDMLESAFNSGGACTG